MLGIAIYGLGVDAFHFVFWTLRHEEASSVVRKLLAASVDAGHECS